jgi:hypothetical protein
MFITFIIIKTTKAIIIKSITVVTNTPYFRVTAGVFSAVGFNITADQRNDIPKTVRSAA